MSAQNEIPPVKTMYLKDGQLVTDPTTIKTGTFLGFPMRGWGDKVSYGVGLSYMLGLTYGGVYGTFRGIQKAPAPYMKVRWTSIVNQTTRYGPWAANSLGMMALAYGCFDSLYEEMREQKDYYNHVAAAFSAGALFKSTSGIRPAFFAGSLLSGAVLAFMGLEPYLPQ